MHAARLGINSYFDATNHSDTAGGNVNAGEAAFGGLAHAGATVKTLIPFNNFTFFEDLSD